MLSLLHLEGEAYTLTTCAGDLKIAQGLDTLSDTP
jgi:hypothetical protein